MTDTDTTTVPKRDYPGIAGRRKAVLQGLRIDLGTSLEHHHRFDALGRDNARRHFERTIKSALTKIDRELGTAEREAA